MYDHRDEDHFGHKSGQGEEGGSWLGVILALTFLVAMIAVATYCFTAG